MLSALRQHSKSFLIYLLFAMIIVVFVFTFNMGGDMDAGCGGADVPLFSSVDGNEITRDNLFMGMTLLGSRAERLDPYTFAAGFDSLPKGTAQDELLPEQADAFLNLMELIYLASDEATRMGFRVDEKELALAMYSGFFREKEVIGEDGLDTKKKEFDETAFLNWVNHTLKASPQEYEDFVTRIILADKLQQFALSNTRPDPLELEIALKAANTKFDLKYVGIDHRALASYVKPDDKTIQEVSANEADLRTWYDSHKEDFAAAASFEEAKAQVTEVVAKNKLAPEFAKKVAAEILEKAKAANGADIEKIVEEKLNELLAGQAAPEVKPLRVESTGKFDLAKAVGVSAMGSYEFLMGLPGIGTIEALSKDIASLTMANPVAPQVYERKPSLLNPDEMLFVVVLAQKEVSTDPLDEETLKSKEDEIRAARFMSQFTALLNGLRNNAMADGRIKRTDDYAAFRAALVSQFDQRKGAKPEEAPVEAAQ